MTVSELDRWIEFGNESETFNTTQVGRKREEPRTITTQIFYKKGKSEEERKKTLEIAREVSKQILSGKATIVDKENVTFQSLLKKPTIKSLTNREPVGIRKARTNIMTDPEAVKIIKENHQKKELKRKKMEEKKEIEKKAVKKEQKERRSRLRPRKDNPKL